LETDHGYRNGGIAKEKTWELISFPIGKKPVGCKWAYTVKYRVDGSIERYSHGFKH